MKRVTQKFTGLLLLALAMSFTLKAQEIGDIYEGGYIFQINEDGIGLIADLEDLCVCSYSSAFSSASSANSQGYNDWFIPSADEMTAMNNNIGPNSIIGNIAGLSEGTNSNTYFVTGEWEDIDGTMYGYYFHLGCGCTQMQWQTGVGARRLRMVRSFNLYIHGCTDAQADNYSSEATFDDGSCIYSEAFTELQAILEAIIAEDGITQDDVDAAYAVGVASVEMLECEEVTTQNIPLDLPQGWSMFGYTCMESVDAIDGFIEISDKIEIVKDESGLTYLPSWDFNAIGSLQFSEGYQIMMIEEVTDFQFCEAIVAEENIVSLQEENANFSDSIILLNTNIVSLEEEIENLQSELDSIYGCMDENACNYDPQALLQNNSCEYESCMDECGVLNGDNSSCSDCAGVPNGTSEDLGCGCGNPASIDGYDCEGNALPQIGDIHHGGMVFEVNGEHGKVVQLSNLGNNMCWETATSLSEIDTTGGYDDWRLPTSSELFTIYHSVGPGGAEGNIGGFQVGWYWSSDQCNGSQSKVRGFQYGDWLCNNKCGGGYSSVARAIHSF